MERLLYYVFRVLVVSRYSMRDSEDTSFVAPKEFTKGSRLPGLGPCHEHSFFAWAATARSLGFR
jgi:hypothetical protein